MIILNGILAGIFLTAPIGPSEILCIHKILKQGLMLGLVTAAGASFADFVLSVIVFFGLFNITNIWIDNQGLIENISTIVLLIFAIIIFLQKPETKEKKHHKTLGVATGFISGFIVIVTNPLSLIVFTTLLPSIFAGAIELKGLELLLFSICIFFGELIWWGIILIPIYLVKGKFNLEKFYILNKLIGIVLVFLAIGMLI